MIGDRISKGEQISREEMNEAVHTYFQNQPTFSLNSDLSDAPQLEHIPQPEETPFTPIVLMIALSFHALFEGIAVGLG